MAYNKNKNFIHLSVILIMATVTISSFSNPVMAAAGNTDKTYTLLEPLPCISTAAVPCPPVGANGEVSTIPAVNLGDFIQYAFNLLIALASVAAVFMIVWGGFLYLTSNSIQKKSDGLSYFKNAIYGLLMILFAFLILKTINPKFVQIQTTIPAITVKVTKTNSPTTLFDQINTEVQNTNAATAAYNAARQTSLDNYNKDQARWDELENMLQSPNIDKATADEYRLEQKMLESDMQNSEAEIIVSAAKTLMNNTALTTAMNNINYMTTSNVYKSTLTPTSLSNEIKSDIDYVKLQQENANLELMNIGAYEETDAVNQQANYAIQTLNLLKVQTTLDQIKLSDSAGYLTPGMYFGNSGIFVGSKSDTKTQIETDLFSIKDQISTISDPTLKQNLQTKIDTAFATLKTKFK